MKRVLVTGGAGFIGSHLVRRLCSMGCQVRVADNLWRGSLENLRDERGVMRPDEFLQKDLCDLEAARAAVQGVDTVVHLAAVVSGVDYVLANEPFVYRTNVLLNSNMLLAAHEGLVERFLYVGSACSYPRHLQTAADGPPLREDQVFPADPESAFGWSRLMGEYESILYEQHYGLPLCILRLHNVYGPHADLSPERAQVIPALVRKAIRYPREEFVVWGDGTQTRDFVFVEDVIEAIVLGLEHGLGKGPIQIATGARTSVRQLAEEITSIARRPIPVVFDPQKPTGDHGRAGDWSKAREVLGWWPRVTLRAGLEATYRWAERRLREAGE